MSIPNCGKNQHPRCESWDLSYSGVRHPPLHTSEAEKHLPIVVLLDETRGSRHPNTEDGDVKIMDFDWCRKVGETRYPSTIEGRHGRNHWRAES